MSNLHDSQKQLLASLLSAGQGVAQLNLGAAQAVKSGVHSAADHVANHVTDTVQGSVGAAKAVGGTIDDINAALLQALASIPGNVRDSAADVRQAISQDVRTVGSTAGSLGKMAAASVEMLPPITQLWNLNAWKQEYKAYGPQFNAAYSSLASNWEAIAQGISARYCAEPVFTPPTKKPAKFSGPGFSLTFSSGNCTFDEEAFFVNHTKVLNCTKPSVTFVKTPANFTSHFKSAPRLVGKSCAISKTFGEVEEKVLFVFDGSMGSMGDLTNLTNKVTGELQAAVSGARIGSAAMQSQVKSFLSQLPLHSLVGGAGGVGGGLDGAGVLSALSFP